MDDPASYGKLIREYQGEGVLTATGGSEFTCLFRCVQRADGAIIARCHLDLDSIDPYHRVTAALVSRDGAFQLLQGTTYEGFQFALESPLVISRLNLGPGGAGVTLIARGMTVRRMKDDRRQIKVIRFGLTNFEFTGTVAEEYQENAWHRVLPLELEECKVRIVPGQGYEGLIRGIKAEKGIDVTCEVHYYLEDSGNLHGAIERVEDLCRLLTIARGTPVTWIYYDVVVDNGQLAHSYHRDSATAPFSATPVIDPRTPNDTKQFVEATFERFREQMDFYDLAKVAHLFALSKSVPFIQTRALVAVALVDFLRGRWAERHNANLIVDEGTFKANLNLLTARIREVLSECFPELDNKGLDMMLSHVQGFKWRPFRRSLKEMRDSLNLPVTNGDINRFLESRHELVHRADFVAQDIRDRTEEYSQVLNFLDKIVLGILGYHGAYVNCTNRQREKLR